MELMAVAPILGQKTHVELVSWPKIPQTELAESQIKSQSKEPRKEEILPMRHTPFSQEIEEGENTTTSPSMFSMKKTAGEITTTTHHGRSANTTTQEIEELPRSNEPIHPNGLQGQRKISLIELQKATTIPTLLTAPSAIGEPSKPYQLVQRVTTLSRLSLGKNIWPDPYLSIGAKCYNVGGNECWKATGPAKEIFKLIAGGIGDLLDARVDELEEGEPVAGNILQFDLYMVGKSAATARPTLLFTCKRPKPRRRAIKFVKESGIMKDHPKFALAESASPPFVLGKGYARLLAGYAANYNRRWSYPLPTPVTLVPRTTSASVHTSNVKTGAIVGGVLGGVLVLTLVGLICYMCRRQKTIKEILRQYESSAVNDHNSYIPARPGFSGGQQKSHVAADSLQEEMFGKLPQYTKAGHPSQPAREPNTPSARPVLGGSNIQSPPRDSWANNLYGVPIVSSSTKLRSTMGGILHCNGVFYGLTVSHIFGSCAFVLPGIENTICKDDPEDDYDFAFDEDSEDNQEIDVTDVAITSQASISDADSTDVISRSTTANSTVSKATPRMSQPVQSVLLFVQGNITSSGNYQNAEQIGLLRVSSSQEGQLGLDWALTELSESYIELQRNTFKASGYDARRIINHNIPFTVEHEVNVTSITGYSGTLTGVLSPSFTHMKLSPRSQFQDVWTVTFDKPLAQGDSGSLVLGSTDGNLYGHVVAGIPEAGIAYIIPAFRTFEDIQQQNGSVQFASNIFHSETRTATVEAKGMKGGEFVGGAKKDPFPTK